MAKCETIFLQNAINVRFWFMPRVAQSVSSLPDSVRASLEVLGAHLRLGRKRRKESMRAWALRMDVSVPTLAAMEHGDPKVSMGVYATALWLLGRDEALRELAEPKNDDQALAQELLVVQNKGKRRNCTPAEELRMAARDAESALLARCVVVAHEDAQSAQDQREANVFRLAAMVIQSRFPHESLCLMQASERYYAGNPNARLPPADVIRKGWILNLPRLRDRLERLLESQYAAPTSQSPAINSCGH
jgi:hypothetical protein